MTPSSRLFVAEREIAVHPSRRRLGRRLQRQLGCRGGRLFVGSTKFEPRSGDSKARRLSTSCAETERETIDGKTQ
jgi:hypothetical protein